jgi:hypothetical protein
MVKLFFLKWQIGRAKMDLSAHMTPEELKLAGLSAPAVKPEQPKEVINNKDKYTPARITFETLFLERKDQLPYTTILDNISMK